MDVLKADQRAPWASELSQPNQALPTYSLSLSYTTSHYFLLKYNVHELDFENNSNKKCVWFYPRTIID